MFKYHFYLHSLLVFSLPFIYSCTNTESSDNSEYNNVETQNELATDSLLLTIHPLNSNDSINHFRGLFNKGETFFISGTDGKILFKSDQLSVAELYQAKYTDLRDIHVLSDSSILVMGIASPAHIWKIKKGETQWKKVYTNMDTLVFMDGMDFWNDSIGLVYGDPLDGYHFILKTTDGGESWNRIDASLLPSPLQPEAGFAASGTGIVCKGNGRAFIGLGGEKARILISNDYGVSWSVEETPLLHGANGKGIYSMAFKDELNGVAVGGNWENPTCDSSKIYTNDGGKSWHLSDGIQHYRSCVTYINKNTYISTGTSGTDISYNGGKSWTLLDSTGFNSILFENEEVGLGVGSRGKICELNLSKK